MAKSSKEMELAIKIAGKVESSFTSALGKAGSGIKSLTVAMAAASAAAMAGVTAAATAAVKVGKEFESAMSQVSATMLLDTGTEEGAAAYAILEKAARECGRSTAFSATEAAEALNELALAGYNAEEAATALPTVLNLAGAGAMSLADASNMLTGALNALQLEKTEDNMNSLADQMAVTASKSATTVAQLGEGMLKIGATAANLKGGTTELSTALGILADNHITAAEGGTHLRNVILSLQSPTDAATSMLNSLGVSVYDAEGNMNSLQDIFGTLSTAMEGMTQAEKDNIIGTIFNKTDLASANALLANCTDRWDELSTAIENSAGACEDMYNIQLDNLEGDIAKLKSGLSDLGITVYKGLNGPLRETTQLGTSMISKLSEAYDEGGLEGMAGAVGGCLAEALNVMGGYAPRMASMGITLISSFVAGIAGNSGAISDVAAQTITVFLSGIIGLLPQVLLAGIDIILNLAQSLTGQIPTLVNSGALAFVAFIQGIIARLPEIAQTAFMLIQTLAGSLANAAPSVIWAILQLIGAIIETIFTTDWVAVGGDLVRTIARGFSDGAKSIGGSVLSAVKGWFTGGSSDGDIETEGAAAVQSYTAGIESSSASVSAAASSLTTAAFSEIDTSAMMEAGGLSAEAFGLGITDNSDTVLTAVETMSETAKDEASKAAAAIKAAFENMTITIPKPKIPVITTTYKTETYGNGGSISLPSFSVAWNALGGIFDQPTVFNTGNGLQGVGEAGPEAILPLDTLWTKMRSILADVVQRNGGESMIEALLRKLQDAGGSGGSGGPGQWELAGAGGPNITYSPTYNLYGSATKEDAVEAERMSQAEFARRMKDWQRDNDRRKF